jgi:prepilin-type N-terminal cleavage/methylation domain-containing protein
MRQPTFITGVWAGGRRPGVDPARPVSAGFTLIEVMVVLTIFVLAAAVVVPSVGKTSLAELRATASKVAGTVRATYDSASLQGRAYRLAVDFKTQTVRVEIDAGKVKSAPGLLGVAAMMQGGGKPSAAKPTGKTGGEVTTGDETAEVVQPPAAVLALLGVPREGADDENAAGLSTFQKTGHDLTMPTDIRLMDVWIEGMSQAINQGTAYLQFFPGGYTQEAMIHLSTAEGTIFTVTVAGLTGATAVIDSFVEVPQ